MKSFPKEKVLTWVGAIIVAVAIFFVGIGIGYRNIPAVDKVVNVFDKEPQIASSTDQADFNIFWQAWNDLNQDYVAPNSVTAQDKVYGAIEGLAQSYGDPYTVFMPPAEAQSFNSQVSGTLDGVGLELGVTDGNLVVISPIKGSPADLAGVKEGDQILKINGTTTEGMDIDTAVDLIRGPASTTVTLNLYRASQPAPFNVTITRSVINIPTVDSVLRPDGVFVISLYSFDEDSPQLFAQALQKFVNSGSNKLILDLRGNPGGYLDAAVDIASWFLPPGKLVVSEDFGGKQPTQQNLTVDNGAVMGSIIPGFKMAILVDGGSASAAEILSGALHDYGIAKLVGETTFGKGSVQEVLNLTPDTNLKITIAKWLTPDGVSISEKGITPDYVVPITQSDVDKGIDPQLNEAVSLLLGK